jgi:hypothetical protein
MATGGSGISMVVRAGSTPSHCIRDSSSSSSSSEFVAGIWLQVAAASLWSSGLAAHPHTAFATAAAAAAAVSMWQAYMATGSSGIHIVVRAGSTPSHCICDSSKQQQQQHTVSWLHSHKCS